MPRPSHPPTTEFGKKLRDLREKRGISQPDLAEAAEISVGHISMLETGKRGTMPRRDAILRLADALSCPAIELLEAAGYDIDEIPPNDGKPNDVERAIKNDPLLREDQKQAMLAQYRAHTGRIKPKF